MPRKAKARQPASTRKRQITYRQKRRDEGLRQLNLMVPDEARETFKALAKAVKEGEDMRTAMGRLAGQPEPQTTLEPDRKAGEPEPPAKAATIVI
jgi:hypothetical protein